MQERIIDHYVEKGEVCLNKRESKIQGLACFMTAAAFGDGFSRSKSYSISRDMTSEEVIHAAFLMSENIQVEQFLLLNGNNPIDQSVAGNMPAAKSNMNSKKSSRR